MIEQLRRRRETAFDINNIVIPYSMASAGRVEKLVYKEIITPTFRLAEEVEEKPSEAASSDCEEDFSDPVFEQRHARAEVEEKNRWLQAFNRPGRSR
jgi:KAT8 regulatory NSL complex subunit 1